MVHTQTRSASSERGSEEVKLEMTPMIDVTFLLLIFFLCSIKFKVLEGKLQTYLPRAVGVSNGPAKQMLEKIDLLVVRTEGRGERDLENLQVYRQWVGDGGWKQSQVEIYLGTKQIKSLAELLVTLKAYRESIPAPIEGADDDLQLNLEALRGAIYEDVIQVVDIAIEAGLTSITFRSFELDA